MCKIQSRYIWVLSNTIFPLFYHIYPSVQKAPWQVYGWQWRPRKSWDFFFMMQKLHSGVWNWTFMANKKEEWIGVSGKISILPETRLFVIFKNTLSNTFPELSLIVCSTWKSEIISGTYSTTIRWCTTGERKKHSRYFFKKHNKNINELMHQRSNDAQTKKFIDIAKFLLNFLRKIQFYILKIPFFISVFTFNFYAKCQSLNPN